MSRPGARRGGTAALALWTALIAGCSTLDPAQPGAARPCAEAFVVQRCDAILLATADNLGVDPATVTNVTILPNPPAVDNVIGGAHPTNVRLTLADGRTMDTSFACPGISGAFRPECMPEPHLVVANALEAYRDFPENATPVPDVDPAAMAAAVPLLIPRLELPIDAPGAKRIHLGNAELANGIIQEATFEIEGTWPAGLVLRGGAVRLDLVPVGGGEPIWNIYEHGWVEGTEPIDVFLVFDVGLVRPGARLVVLDLRVR